MTRIQASLRNSAFATLVGLLAIFATLAANAQDNKPITPNSADVAAAREAKRSPIHSMPANTPAAAAHPKEAISAAIVSSAATPFQGGGPRYPGDLSNQGGAVVGQAQSHAIYITHSAVGCTTPSCWGNPEGFLQSLAKSDFIHITDQYVDRSDNNRYTVGSHVSGTFVPYPTVPLTDNDVLAAVHAVASGTHQTGYGHIYHVFLPPGTDECFDATFSTCYSPDNPNTFYFCAYHSSATFSDIGHVLYTVEPYQNVGGCSVAPGSPDGQLADSTDDVLSHETFETITDPDGTAWWNSTSNALYGSEIGDECQFIIFFPSAVYFDPPAFRIGGKKYAVQSEYDNYSHSCNTEP